MIKKIAIILTAALAVAASNASAKGLIDAGPAPQFVEIDLHILAGGAGMTQNYAGKFSAITELNNSMGSRLGFGAGAVFGFNDFIGLGTELNFTFSQTKIDMMVEAEDNSSMSNIYLHNRFIYANIPIFIQFRFHPAPNIRWNVDGGIYYNYGVSGSQKQTIYNATLNQLDQLVPQVVEAKPDYFRSADTFLNSFNHGDYGLHLATGLLFGRHINVGVVFSMGLKNISYTSGLVNPNIHNYAVSAKLGYKF